MANGIREAKLLLLSVLIHQWQYSLVDCLIRCNQLPFDEHTTQFAFIGALMNNPHSRTDHRYIVIIGYFICHLYYVHKAPLCHFKYL